MDGELLLLCSLVFTWIHLTEEVVGPGGPLWKSFGEIVNLTRIPWWAGFAIFTAGLGILLSLLSWGAYWCESQFLLSVLLGCRMGDSVISHWWLRYVGLSKPNPGIWSTTLYVVESTWLVWFSDVTWFGFALGVTAFAAVLPTLDLAGHKFFPHWA